MAPSEVPGASTAEWLREYGPWALVVVCFSVIIYLFHALSKARDRHHEALKEHAVEIKRISVEHKEEMKVILNRLIEATTSQAREYHTLLERVNAVLDSLQKRLEARSQR